MQAAGVDYEPPARSPEHPRPSQSLTTFLWGFVAVGLAIGAWSLATPLMAAPDEPTHVIAAAAAVRGEIDAPHRPTPFGPMSVVTVPSWVARAAILPNCFAFKPHTPAGCQPHVNSSTIGSSARTQFSNYPPLYYFIAGSPSLVWKGSLGLYMMRLAGALVNAAFIAVGLTLLARFHPRRLTLVGALVALTPMVLFVTSVVNSSGMEIAAAFAAWCGGLCIVARSHVPRTLTLATGIAFAVLVLSRPISPYNAAVIVLVLLTLAGWSRAKTLVRQRSFRYLWVPVLSAVLIAGALLVIGGPPGLLGTATKPPLGWTASIWMTLHLTQERLRQTIGQFGWLDVSVPLFVFVVWLSAVAALTTSGLVNSMRTRWALVVLAVAVVVTPLFFEPANLNAVGPFWQGRYWLPLAIGLPLVASAAEIGRHHRRSRLYERPGIRATSAAAIGIVLGAAQLTAFLTALHRYQTGTGARPGTPVRWVPPGGVPLVVGMLVAGLLLLVGLVVRNAVQRSPDGVPDSEPGSHGRVPVGSCR